MTMRHPLQRSRHTIGESDALRASGPGITGGGYVTRLTEHSLAEEITEAILSGIGSESKLSAHHLSAARSTARGQQR